MVRIHLLHIIGTCPGCPLSVKMWCLRQTMKIVHQEIEKLPPEKRAVFDNVMGKFRA